jgi:hypothetical protein
MALTSPYSGTAGPMVEAVVPDDRLTHMRNRVSWGAILAGVAAGSFPTAMYSR